MNLTGEYCIDQGSGGGGGGENKGILRELDSQRAEVQFCDVTLYVEDEKFPAHRCVLAAASPYFKSMFDEYKFSESRKADVELKSVSKVAMSVILDMIYTGTLKLNVETMHQVLCAGDHFLMNEVKFSCGEFMLMVLNSDNAPDEALKIRRSAELYLLTDLEHEADRVITQSFAQVAQSPAFCELTDSELLSFMKSDYIQEGKEQVFWHAATDWIQHDTESRSHLTDNIMECVRFPLIQPEILLGVIAEHPLMVKSDRCRDLITEATKYQVLGRIQSSLQTSRTKPRCTIRDTILYCLSGNKFRCYLPLYNRWYALASPAPRDTVGVPDQTGAISVCHLVSVDGLVYACTQATRPQETGLFELIRMQQYSVTANKWKDCCLPTKVSVPMFLMECNSELFACSRNAVEKYSEERDVWEVMSISRLSPCQFAVSDDNRILLYTLEEGICQEICMDKPNMVTTRQVMSPNRFISEVISATKLSNHEVFLSLRTPGRISRKVFNVKTNLWRDAGIFHGTACLQPRPGQHFPHWLNPAEPWITLGDKKTNSLYILGTRSGMVDVPGTAQSELRDAVLPFFLLDMTKKKWTRLSALPEYMEERNLSVCIADGLASIGSAVIL